MAGNLAKLEGFSDPSVHLFIYFLIQAQNVQSLIVDMK